MVGVANTAQLAREGAPIEWRGLNFYPLLMRRYDEFLRFRSVLSLRMGTLPAKYLSMDYLTALWEMDMDAAKSGGQVAGAFYSAIALCCMALQIDYTDKQFLQENIVLAPDTPEHVKIMCIALTQNGHTVNVTPAEFSREIRPILALQNGVELPNESDNAQLIKSEEERLALATEYGDGGLQLNTETLIASVAYLSHVREREIYEAWTVREFENRRAAIERDKRYMLYAQAELSGFVSFKQGNPAKSWCYDCRRDVAAGEALQTLGQAFA